MPAAYHVPRQVLLTISTVPCIKLKDIFSELSSMNEDENDIVKYLKGAGSNKYNNHVLVGYYQNKIRRNDNSRLFAMTARGRHFM